MTLEIQTLRDDGSGYMVVTNDDGATFGQNFHHMPVHDRDALVEKLSDLAEDVLARQAPRPPASPQAIAMIRNTIQSAPRRGAVS